MQTLPALHDPKAVTVYVEPCVNFEPTTSRPEVATAVSVVGALSAAYPVKVHVSCQDVLGLLY